MGKTTCETWLFVAVLSVKSSVDRGYNDANYFVLTANLLTISGEEKSKTESFVLGFVVHFITSGRKQKEMHGFFCVALVG